ncbi:MAG: AarF/ABC1/UbiB kinase family protein [Acidobacteria bacterium]|nr:AarF/ABC1/UbiB kinase family protein [Acidobacteriota bacterium]
MNWFNFIQLMKMIYGRNSKINLKKIQKMGLLAVKIGQVHALRLDFLPVEKCQELSILYRNNNDIPPENVFSRIDKSKFEDIDKEPIASASVGQVHKAKYNGKYVAVKIIKQNFKNRFIKDVKSIRRFLNFSIFFYPKLKGVFDPLGILNHIEEYTLKEIDLLQEIEGQETLKEIFDANKDRFDLSLLKFPNIYKEISSSDIMVSDFVEGKTFDQLLDEKALPYEKLLQLFKIHGFYLFKIGTFHGDIHPGNIILSEDKIYFVDTGAISHASKRLSQGLLRFFEFLSVYDYEQCAKELNNMAEVKIEGELYKKFVKNFLILYDDFKDRSVSEVSLTRKMMETIKLGVNSGMRFEKGMFPIIKSLMYLDGMVLRCNPNAILLKDMRKYIDELKEN